jgi:hypothetical protein
VDSSEVVMMGLLWLSENFGGPAGIYSRGQSSWGQTPSELDFSDFPPGRSYEPTASGSQKLESEVDASNLTKTGRRPFWRVDVS